jgi:hypothetical protein
MSSVKKNPRGKKLGLPKKAEVPSPLARLAFPGLTFNRLLDHFARAPADAET